MAMTTTKDTTRAMTTIRDTTRVMTTKATTTTKAITAASTTTSCRSSRSSPSPYSSSTSSASPRPRPAQVAGAEGPSHPICNTLQVLHQKNPTPGQRSNKKKQTNKSSQPGQIKSNKIQINHSTELLDAGTWLSLIDELWRKDALSGDRHCTQRLICEINFKSSGHSRWPIFYSRFQIIKLS